MTHPLNKEKCVPAHHNEEIFQIIFFLMNTPVAIIRDTDFKQELVLQLQQHGFSTRIALQSSMIPVCAFSNILLLGCDSQCNGYNGVYSSFPGKRPSRYFP